VCVVVADELLVGFFQFFTQISLASSIILVRTGNVLSLNDFLQEKMNSAVLSDFKVFFFFFFCVVIALRPQTLKHVRGGWSHYTPANQLILMGLKIWSLSNPGFELETF
jgi:hypothetical protein